MGRQRAGWIAVGAAIVVWALLPALWIVSLSFKTPDEIGLSRAFLPRWPTLENYRVVFTTSLFTAALRNSIGIALLATLLAGSVARVAAHALARLRFPGRRTLLVVALAIAMFPQAALISPLFDMWRRTGLYDTWPGLIIPYLTFALPLAIWTMTAFFREIPWELEQAAQMD